MAPTRKWPAQGFKSAPPAGRGVTQVPGMHKSAIMSLAIVLAAAAALSLEISELIHRVALENAANQIAGLPSDYSWQRELWNNGRTFVADLLQPLNLWLFLAPVVAAAFWCRSGVVGWTIVAFIGAAFVFDLDVLIQSISHANNDRKGCEACLYAWFVHMPLALASSVAAFGGLISWLWRRARA